MSERTNWVECTASAKYAEASGIRCDACTFWDKPWDHLREEAGEPVAFCTHRPLSPSVKLKPAIASANFSQLGTRGSFFCEHWKAKE